MTTKDLASRLSEFSNKMCNEDDVSQLADMICSDHPTLQQKHFGLFLECIMRWANLYYDNLYDARNESTCLLSSRIMEMLEEYHVVFTDPKNDRFVKVSLPYI